MLLLGGVVQTVLILTIVVLGLTLIRITSVLKPTEFSCISSREIDVHDCRGRPCSSAHRKAATWPPTDVLTRPTVKRPSRSRPAAAMSSKSSATSGLALLDSRWSSRTSPSGQRRAAVARRSFNGTSLQNSKLIFKRYDARPNLDWDKGRASDRPLNVRVRPPSSLAGSGPETSAGAVRAVERWLSMTATASLTTAPC